MTANAQPEIAEWIAAWFAARTPGIPLQPTENYFDAGAIDSFEVIVLIEELETRFDIRFAEIDFKDRRFASVAGLATIVSEKSAAKSTPKSAHG